MSQRLRILLADDDAGVVKATSRALSTECEIVGSVSDIDGLLQAAVQLVPEVVLLDLSLCDKSRGLGIIRHMRMIAPKVSIIVFTAHDDPELERATLAAGAAAFVWKLAGFSKLLETIHRVIDQARPGAACGS